MNSFLVVAVCALVAMAASSPAQPAALGTLRPTRLSSSSVATRDGVRLAIQDSGSGKPVVFVHGWILGADVWEYQTSFISRNGYRTVAYDQRGCGDSEKPGGGYGIDSLADDLNDVLEALDLRNVTLVAHSLGSAEAVRYIARHGNGRVERLVLVGTITPGANPEAIQKRVFDSLTRSLQHDRPSFLAAALPQAFLAPGGSAGPVSPSLAQWVVGISMRCTLHASIETGHAVAYADARTDLDKITVPTTLIHGARDLSAPLANTAVKTMAAIQGSDLITYEVSGHALFLTDKERLNADILAILNRDRAAAVPPAKP